MPFEIEFIRNTLEAEGFHLESDGPLDNFYNFAVAIREHTIKELQGDPRTEFVRLSEEEIERLMDSALAPKEIDERDLHYFSRAIEDALEEKNK